MLGKRKRVTSYVSSVGKKTKKNTSRQPRFSLLKNPTTVGKKAYTRAVLKYCENTTFLNPGSSGAASVYVFTANGLYDPNITGVGHQPVGFDQYMQLYNEYVVVGSTIKVVFANSDNGYPISVGISLLDFSTTGADMRKYVENGNTTWTICSQRGGGKDVTTLNHQADIRKFSTQEVFNEQGFTGTASNNPLDTHYYHIWAVAADGSTDTGVINFNVEITYDVYFRDTSFTDLS